MQSLKNLEFTFHPKKGPPAVNSIIGGSVGDKFTHMWQWFRTLESMWHQFLWEKMRKLSTHRDWQTTKRDRKRTYWNPNKSINPNEFLLYFSPFLLLDWRANHHNQSGQKHYLLCALWLMDTYSDLQSVPTQFISGLKVLFSGVKNLSP